MNSIIAYFIKLLELLLPQPCFDELFVHLNFFNVNCIKVFLVKCLGFGIIAGSVMVKVPQIVKILSGKSAEGISIYGMSFELLALTSTLSYSLANNFPFSAYGEAIFLIIQTAIIAFLILFYPKPELNQDFSAKPFIYVIAYSIFSVSIYLFASLNILWFLQSSVTAMVFTARMIQVKSNYDNRSTGQLSAITISLILLGSIGRILTSLQEADATTVVSYLVSSICNLVIFLQLLYYWRTTDKKSDLKTD